MPELPEVETLRRGLERETLGERIVQVEIANSKVLKGQTEDEFRARVIGSAIRKVARRGKYLLIEISTDNKTNPQPDEAAPQITLCVHLKMRGQLLLEPASMPPGPYYCVSLILDNGGSAEKVGTKKALRFYDMWTWGEIRALTQAELEGIDGLANMGAEPLESGWDGSALHQKLIGRRGPIKTMLLDQKVVAGVGNIYADESLFRSGISPVRVANSLTTTETDRLAQVIRTVLSEAVDGGGTASEEYVDLAGSAGRFTPRVYDRGGKPCETCGTPLTRIRLGGRGTVFCPSCQN